MAMLGHVLTKNYCPKKHLGSPIVDPLKMLYVGILFTHCQQMWLASGSPQTKNPDIIEIHKALASYMFPKLMHWKFITFTWKTWHWFTTAFDTCSSKSFLLLIYYYFMLSYPNGSNLSEGTL